MNSDLRASRLSRKVTTFCLIAAVVAIAGIASIAHLSAARSPVPELAPAPKATADVFYPTKAQWSTLSVVPAEERVFRDELVTDGRIAVDEDRSTPIFSPYSARIKKLAVKPGQAVKAGDLLLTLDATDTIQGQSDFISAKNALDKAKAQLQLAQTREAREKSLYEGKASPLKEWQQAQADLVAAQSDLDSAKTSFLAAISRLHLLGKTDEEIALLASVGKVSGETPIFSPIAGTVISRRAGPGQYLNAGASDPAFTIGDLSTVWLVANVRESDAGKVRLGQKVQFKVLAFADRTISGTIDYVASSVDPTTRRLAIRATIPNDDVALKPEMFANVTVFTSDEQPSVAVPRDAILYEGNVARVWTVNPDGGIVARDVTVGLVNGNMAQILSGITVGEKLVARGSLFIDRVALARQ